MQLKPMYRAVLLSLLVIIGAATGQAQISGVGASELLRMITTETQGEVQ